MLLFYNNRDEVEDSYPDDAIVGRENNDDFEAPVFDPETYEIIGTIREQ